MITCQTQKPDRLVCLFKCCYSYSKSLKILICFPGQMNHHLFLSARHCKSISPLTSARASPAPKAPKLLSIPLDELKVDESSSRGCYRAAAVQGQQLRLEAGLDLPSRLSWDRCWPAAAAAGQQSRPAHWAAACSSGTEQRTPPSCQSPCPPGVCL